MYMINFDLMISTVILFVCFLTKFSEIYSFVNTESGVDKEHELASRREPTFAMLVKSLNIA